MGLDIPGNPLEPACIGYTMVIPDRTGGGNLVRGNLVNDSRLFWQHSYFQATDATAPTGRTWLSTINHLTSGDVTILAVWVLKEEIDTLMS